MASCKYLICGFGIAKDFEFSEFGNVSLFEERTTHYHQPGKKVEQLRLNIQGNREVGQGPDTNQGDLPRVLLGESDDGRRSPVCPDLRWARRQLRTTETVLIVPIRGIDVRSNQRSTCTSMDRDVVRTQKMEHVERVASCVNNGGVSGEGGHR